MSILNVEHLTHGFGDRAIFEDVSFRLLAGEHIGLVGANGEGKSTFMNIVGEKCADRISGSEFHPAEGDDNRERPKVGVCVAV